MIIKIKISKKTFNELSELIGEKYEWPTDKKTLNQIRYFVANELAICGINRYDGFDRVDFYDWMSNIIAKKFKLKPYSQYTSK